MKRTLLALAIAIALVSTAFGQYKVPLSDGHALSVYTNLKSDYLPLFDNKGLGESFDKIFREYNLSSDPTVRLTVDTPRLQFEVKNIQFKPELSPRLVPFKEGDQTYLPLGFYKDVALAIGAWAASLTTNPASPADLVSLVRGLSEKPLLPSSFTCAIVNDSQQRLIAYGSIASLKTVEFDRKICYESASGKYRFIEIPETATNMANLKDGKFFLEKPDLNTVHPTNYTIVVYKFFGLQ